jgi:hypothetical protein
MSSQYHCIRKKFPKVFDPLYTLLFFIWIFISLVIRIPWTLLNFMPNFLTALTSNIFKVFQFILKFLLRITVILVVFMTFMRTYIQGFLFKFYHSTTTFLLPIRFNEFCNSSYSSPFLNILCHTSYISFDSGLIWISYSLTWGIFISFSLFPWAVTCSAYLFSRNRLSTCLALTISPLSPSQAS